MDTILSIEKLLGDFFKVLNGLPDYIAIEENEEETDFNQSKLKEKLKKLIDIGIEWRLKKISALIDRNFGHYKYLSQILLNFGFEQYASKVQVFRDLQGIKDIKTNYKWRYIDDFTLSEMEFKWLWRHCMSGSQNAPSSYTIDEHLRSVESELGEGWKNSCKAVYKEGKPIGISIPHIEPGTHNEGRLFYFGILPEERGKGHSAKIHYESMCFLKKMGATYYIGSTHESNKKMQNVFFKNGCSLKRQTESYYKFYDYSNSFNNEIS